MSKVNWDLVNSYFENGKEDLALGVLHGYPEFINPLESVFAPGIELQPKWDIPKEVAICTAIVGAMHSKATNPYHPITVEEIRDEALEACAAGASNVHIHVRDENGVNTFDLDKFHKVIDPIREQYPEVLICGCMVPFTPGDWEKMDKALADGLFDQTPVNTVASYLGDSLFCKSPAAMIKKAEMCERNKVKPQIAVYSDGDIDNARRYLIETGVVSLPSYWILLPGIVGCSPMYGPMDMIDVLSSYVRRIKEIDPNAEIMVCAGGRASSYLSTLALLMGLNVRVGKEDTIWRYPHSDEKIKSNAEIYKDTAMIAKLIGREPCTPAQYVKKMGLMRQGGKLISK